MRIHFGLALHDGALPSPTTPRLGEAWMGPRQLLPWLEERLGLGQPATDVEHLRIEQYRQALKTYWEQHPDAFFGASFLADDLGTAAALLSRRDELLQAGWHFDAAHTTAERLRVLATIEAYWQADTTPIRHLGEPDRLVAVLAQAGRIPRFLDALHLCDARSLFPPIWRRIFQRLDAAGLRIDEPTDYPAPADTTDLARWQAFLQGDKSTAPVLTGDGSLLVLRATRETHLAAYLTQLLRQNATFRPGVLLPQANRTLDNALSMEGLPSMGIPSASLARPGLQVLKLAPVFLWDPIDPYKVMEFVSLTVKPLEAGLGQRMAAFLADTPGLFSDRWFGMIRDYLDNELPNRLSKHSKVSVDDVRREYNFWFNRKRVDSRSERVSKADVSSVYAHLQHWATALGRDEEAPTLMVLAAQARKIVELLDALPEDTLSHLELERIVRTIYEPAPLRYRDAEAGHMPVVNHPAAIIAPVDELVWWDFYEHEPDYFFSRWYPREWDELAASGVYPETPEQQNERLIAQRKRPVLWTQQRLVLCQPDFCNGDDVNIHPLMGYLMAAFGDDLTAITLNVDTQRMGAGWQRTGWALPQFTLQSAAALARPAPYLRLERSLIGRDEETPTSLETLLYYPYQWVFRYHIKLRPSSILSVVQDSRLLGNLAHRLLEKLLEQPDATAWPKPQLEEWINVEIPLLLQKEGATLLMYGREPDRVAFVKQMKFAAWSLLTLLRQNNWKVLGTEEELAGQVGSLSLKGRADLVLQRGDERAIIDMKWRGMGRYTNIITSAEDIQLALYAHLLEPQEQWAHTAYYIIERGRLLTRNTQAFKDIQPVQAEADHVAVYEELLQKITHTYDWRVAQLEAGTVEIRCAQTQSQLAEDDDDDQWINRLEMKTTDAYFDDYGVLIGLVS